MQHRIWTLLLPLAAFAAAGTDLRIVNSMQDRDTAAVRSLLQQHADVNATQGDGATALLWAAHWNDLETAKLLIAAGANVNATTDGGVTPLWEACGSSSAPMVETLLKGGAKPNATLESGATPLMMCSRTGSAASVRLLLDKGANFNASETRRGQTALMWAAAEKHPQITRLLLDRGADIHARSKVVVLPSVKSDQYSAGDGNYEGDFHPVTQGGFTPLLFAAQSGDLDSVKMLLEAGADANETTPEGSSALLRASANRRVDVAAYLLEHGANANAADENGMTALHWAVLRGYYLLRGHSHKPYNDYLYRPDMPELVKVLLAHGAKPNVRIAKGPEVADYVHGNSPIGATPLLLAAASNDAEVMRMLLAAGADPNLGQENNITPLMMNCGLAVNGREGNRLLRRMDGVKTLVEAGADVNATNDLGQTALHGAGTWGMNDVIQYLVDKGAKVDAKDKYGQTPWSLASALRPSGYEARATSLARGKTPRKATAELLVKLGANPVPFPGAKQNNELADAN